MTSPEDTDELVQDELTSLKARADMMGIPYHPSIGVEKLREKVTAFLNRTQDAKGEPIAPVQDEEAQRRALIDDATRLVRVRVACMNPAKKEWQGEIITVGNSVVGTHKKYIPFNADEGWHIPNIMYQALLQRECQIFVTVPDGRGGKMRQGKLIREFSVEVLPPLTGEELAELARRQAMAAGATV